MQRRQVGGRERADQEMGGDGRRDEGEGPIARRPNGVQENRRAVEADAPTEDGKDERAGDDAPAVESSRSRACGDCHAREPARRARKMLRSGPKHRGGTTI